MKLRFEREYDNEYDPKAVAIYYEWNLLGYVPRDCNSKIARICDNGNDEYFDVRINRISPDLHPNDQIGVSVDY